MDSREFECIIEGNTLAVYDVSACVKSWGQRGTLAGGLAGFALGTIFVVLPQVSNVLAFGVVGTLLVGVIVGAVIVGTFGVCAAALYGKGVLRVKGPLFDVTRPADRRLQVVRWRDGDTALADAQAIRGKTYLAKSPAI